MKSFNARTGLLVLRCGRGEHASIWASITLMQQLRGRAAMFRLLHLAGTPQQACAPRAAPPCGCVAACADDGGCAFAGTLRACQSAALEHSEAVLQRMAPRLGAAAAAQVQAAAAEALTAMEP